MMQCLTFFIFISATFNYAYSFTPNHQEACCLAMQQQEPLTKLSCEGLNLTPELCKSIIQNFSNAAKTHHQMMSTNGTEPKHPAVTNLKPQTVTKRDLFILGIILFVVATVLLLKRTKKNNSDIFRHLLAAGLPLINAPLLFVFASLCLSKISCLALGNLCRTGTILIPIFIVTGILGAIVSCRYLYSCWQNRMTEIRKNSLILIVLLIAGVAVKILNLEIP